MFEYEILIQTSSFAFVSTATCDGANLEVVETRACTIPYSELLAAPYSLTLGEEILFIVKAKNSIGWGTFSITPTIKDTVKTHPLAPLTKVIEGALTDDSQIHITWQKVEDPETGLDTVLSYVVYWDNGSNANQWVVLVEETSSFTFTFIESSGIVRASYFKFYYLAVNQ